MQVVVVTGSTRGIGLGLARELLVRDHAVLVSGRTAETVADAVGRLKEETGADAVAGVACDVTSIDQVRGLWDAALERFQRVDIWINNAGVSNRLGGAESWQADDLRAVVQTNLLGALHGCRVAVSGMLAQKGGAIWNMEGLGSDGRKVAGLAPYGASKAAVRYLTDALVAELKGTPVRMGGIRPGMVVTDMLRRELDRHGPEERARIEKVYNLLADRVETVTPWLVEQLLASRRHGDRIAWLGGLRVMGRFLAAPFRTRDVLGPSSSTTRGSSGSGA